MKNPFRSNPFTREQQKMARRLDKVNRAAIRAANALTWRVRFARWVLRGSQYDVFYAPHIAQVERITLAIQEYVQTSGHLTRVYTVGQRMQSFARNLIYFLSAAKVKVSND